MGEGQEIEAHAHNTTGFLSGSWTLLMNCHLGLGYMNELESILKNTKEVDDGFRLWITSGQSEVFPMGLLQMSIKVTNEPPKGLKSGIART